jgi:hypothetical protein
MSEFTIVLEYMTRVKLPTSDTFIPGNRSGDVIEADNIDGAWELARKKYYIDNPEIDIQIVDIVPGNVEVVTPEPKQPEQPEQAVSEDVKD